MTTFQTAKLNEEARTAKRTALDEVFTKALEGSKKGRVRGLDKLNQHRVDIAALFVEVLEDAFLQADPTGFLAEPRSLAYGDEHLMQELQGTLTVVRRSPGSKPMAQRLTKSERFFTPVTREINVDMPLEEIAVGSITASQAATAMAQAIARHRVSMVLDAIDAAVTAVADRSGRAGWTLRYTALSETNLARAVDGLRDDGESPTILGRQSALYPDLRTYQTSEEGKFENEQRGVVARHLGAPVVTLLEKANRLFNNTLIIPNNRVWVAGGTKGAFVYEVDMSFLNYAVIDERTATFSTGLRWADGCFVHNPFMYRVIEKP